VDRFGLGCCPEEAGDVLYPSDSACSANAAYLRFAWDSPAKASIAFSSVAMVIYQEGGGIYISFLDSLPRSGTDHPSFLFRLQPFSLRSHEADEGPRCL